MKKKFLITMVISMLLLLGALGVNAASSTVTFTVYKDNNSGVSSYHYLYGDGTFTVTKEDVKKNILGVTEKKECHHKLFANDAGYHEMSFWGDPAINYNYIRKQGATKPLDDFYQYALSAENGGNYGGTPCHVLAQTTYNGFEQGTYETHLRGEARVRMATAIANVWTKDEVFVKGYKNHQYFTLTRTFDDLVYHMPLPN